MSLGIKFLLPSLLRSVLTRILTRNVWPGGSGGRDGAPALLSRWHFRKSHFVDKRRFPKAWRRDGAIGLSIWVTCWCLEATIFTLSRDIFRKFQNCSVFINGALLSDPWHCFQTRKDNSAPKLTPKILFTPPWVDFLLRCWCISLLLRKQTTCWLNPPTSRLSISRPPETPHWRIRSSRVWAAKIMFGNREEGNQLTGATWLQIPQIYWRLKPECAV